MPDAPPPFDPDALIGDAAERLREVARRMIRDALEVSKPVTLADVVAVLEREAETLPAALAAAVAAEVPKIAEEAIKQAEVEIADAREQSGKPFPAVNQPSQGDFTPWLATAIGTLTAALRKRVDVAVDDPQQVPVFADAEELTAEELAELDEMIRKAVDELFDTMAARTVNDSRMEAFRANADIVQKVKVVTVADAKRSEICAHMNGATFDPKRPVPTPPYHAGCRSYLRAITTAKRKKGATPAEIYRQNWAIYRRLEREAKAAEAAKAEGRALEVLELRFAPADLDGAAGTFRGIASAYGVLDAHGTEFRAGAFAASLAERRASGQRIPILLHHDPKRVAGVVTDLRDTPQGLEIEGRFITDTANGREGYALAKAGGMALSVGFKRLSDLPRPGGGRTITKANLAEVSLVAVASNPRTKILEVRATTAPDADHHHSLGDTCMTTKATTAASDKSGAETTAATTTATTTETRNDPAAEMRSAVDAINKRLDRIEARSSRTGVTGTETRAEAEVETRAFSHFIRAGREAMGADEIRSLRVADDTAGGYLAPDQFVAELLRNVVQFSPIRSVARVANTASGAVILPKRTGTLTAAWVGETAARPDTAPAYGQNRYPVHELACYVDVSNAMLEDSALDVAAELSFDFAEEFGKAEGTAFLTGSGSLKPAGIMNDADITNTVSGDASKVTADGLIQLYHDLPAAYRANGVWLMNSNTVATVRKLKDSVTGAYLLLPAGIAGAPATTLLGRPVLECPDLDDVGAGAFPVVFGDFMQGFRIFDRVNLSVLRDPYSQAANGMTRFHARRRLAAGVAKAEAFRKLKIAAA